jgi:UDP-N-acetyl-D-glucosamine dehydrogenase
MGIDIWEVVEAAKTKPFGFMPFYPGPGVGGHCIPVDPYYLSWKARAYDFSTKFIELAAETNQDMPFFTVDKLRRVLRDRGTVLAGSRLLVIGAAFKRDVDDARNSPAIRTMEILLREGAAVTYHDPHVPRIVLRSSLYSDGAGRELRSVPLTGEVIAAADCVVILVGHTSMDRALVVRHAKFVFDTVNALKDHRERATIVRL